MSRSSNYLGGVFVVGLLLLNSACAAKQTGQATTAAAQPSAPAPAQQPVDAHGQVPRITVVELKQLMAEGQVVVVDVRPAEAYNLEHIKGSINLPMDKIKAGEYKKLPHDKRIVTYCSCGTEGTSAAAATQLESAGFKNTAALLGGTNAWKQSGGEMEKSSPKA
ncbi:MAG TPA: rhodanese-like domain-containing protein [Blastocatellia bacterium]|jgi:rhodanese-related sulfurtransferase|nr:rhodanese-like domain-containing protein [Blastocatellia bacterium]